MIGKISFVLMMVFMACFIAVLAWLGWVNGCAWSRRTEHFRS